jgi:hypothetical protein
MANGGVRLNGRADEVLQMQDLQTLYLGDAGNDDDARVRKRVRGDTICEAL